MEEVEFSLAATLPDVAQATTRVRSLLPAWLDSAECDAIELGVAEALTNVVEHGYGGETGEEIRVRLSERRGALVIDVYDRGQPMPEGRLAQADETTFLYDPTDLAEIPEGGMGLALIKAAFQEVRYRSRAGVNRLQMVKRI